MKKRITLYVRSFFTIFHILAAKICNIKGFHSPFIQDFSFSTKISVSGGKISLGRHIHTKRNVVLEADGGEMEIGEGCFFNNGCMLVSKEKITVGKNTSFGPNVLVYDHDHDIHSHLAVHDSGFVTSPVTIGDDVWIGAGSVILRGSVIGDGCVIGAGSVIKGVCPPDSVIIQKRSETTVQKRTMDERCVCRVD